jgi:hypothetical protein
MVWVVLVLVAVSWLVVSIIFEQERVESVPVLSRIAARLQQLPVQLRRLRSSHRPQTLRFRAEPVRSWQMAAGPHGATREVSAAWMWVR